MANRLLSVLLAVFVFGLIWATLYDTLNSSLPEQYPGGPTEQPNTWFIMLWLWNVSVALIALNLGISSIAAKTRTLTPTILFSALIFIAWTLIPIMWIVLFTPLNHTIPDAFLSVTGGVNTVPDWLPMMINNGFVLLMIGTGIGMFARST